MFLVIFQKTSAKGSMIVKYKELQESAKQTQNILDQLPPDSKRDHVQFTTMDAQFVMSGKVNVLLNSLNVNYYDNYTMCP